MPEQEDTTREELTAEIALERPNVSLSWSDVPATAEPKPGLKYCRDPPEMYGTQRTKEIPHIEDIHRPLRISSAGQISALSKTSKSRATLPTKPLNAIERRNLRQGMCFGIFILRYFSTSVIPKPSNKLSSWPRKNPRSILEAL